MNHHTSNAQFGRRANVPDTVTGVTPLHPWIARGSIDRARIADTGYLIETAVAGYSAGVERGCEPDGIRSLDFQTMTFRMSVPAEQRNVALPVNTFQDLADGTWAGPITSAALVSAVRGKIEWGAAAAELPDWMVVDRFLDSPVAGLGMTVKSLFEDLVFVHNRVFRHDIEWGLDGLEKYKGGKQRLPLAPPPDTRVGENIAVDVPAVVAELRRIANGLVDGSVKANAQVVPLLPSIILGVAALLDWQWNVTEDRDPSAPRINERSNWTRLAGVVVELIDPPTWKRSSWPKLYQRAFERLTPDLQAFFVNDDDGRKQRQKKKSKNTVDGATAGSGRQRAATTQHTTTGDAR